MTVSIAFDWNNVLDDVIGARHGLTEDMLDDLKPRARAADRQIRRLRERGTIGFYDLARAKRRARELDRTAALGQTIAGRFANFVVLGIGGSALGPICVQRALGHTYYNLLTRRARKNAPRVFILDNVDPEWLADALDVMDPAETCFNVITKSGGTPETVAQFMAFYDEVAERVGTRRAAQHFIATTTRGKGALWRAAKKLRIKCLTIPENVGGRFSELTAVGLFPAAVAGFDIHGLVAGAEAVRKRCESPDLLDNPAYLNGAIHYLADWHRGKSVSVMMPYSQALREVADWYCQLWAESLGKRRGRPPHEVCVGQTPVGALGTTDQHSQIQLYVDGPNDKIVTLIGVRQFRKEFSIGTRLNKLMPDHTCLGGRDIAELFQAEREATEFALARDERPSVRITLDTLDAAHVGGLLFFFMVQTAFAGGLYGINAFDQPGVEEGKKATAALMARGRPQDLRKLRQLERYREKRTRPGLRIDE